MDAAPLKSDGPFQAGRGARGQYVCWITLPMPKPETVAAHGVKTPVEYIREQFIELGVAVDTACGPDVLEAACFQESHADSLLLNTVLVGGIAAVPRGVMGS